MNNVSLCADTRQIPNLPAGASLVAMWGDEVRILDATGAKIVDTKDGAEPLQAQVHDPTARVRYGVPQNEECMSLTAHRGVCTGAADQSDKTCARDSAGQRWQQVR